MSTESLKKKIQELAKSRGMGEEQAHVPVCEVCGKPATAPIQMRWENTYYPEDDPRRYPSGHHCPGCEELNKQGWRKNQISTIVIRRNQRYETEDL